MRATRIILVVIGLLTALLVLGAVVAVLGARSLDWSPGDSTVHVVGVAMAPTIANGDYLLVQPYSASRPKVGDIVVMHDPYDRSRGRRGPSVWQLSSSWHSAASSSIAMRSSGWPASIRRERW